MKPGYPVIDVLDFIARGAEQSGLTPLSAFTRVMEMLPAQIVPAQEQAVKDEVGIGQVAWSIRGQRSSHGQRFLHLGVRARPVLICQRCMQPFVFDVDSGTQLEVVTSQAALEAGDDPDDVGLDAPDKILAQSGQPVLDLVEDELILSLPYIPRHEEECVKYEERGEPEQVGKKPSPFAALAALKKQ